MGKRIGLLEGISGVRFAYGPSAILDKAVDRIRGMRPEIDPEVFDAYLSGQKKTSEIGPDFRGIVIAAIRVPAYRIRFMMEGKEGWALIPPTYALTEKAIEKADKAAEAAFGSCTPIRAPFKTLAVAMGLAEYGRNNLAYVDGFGSYVRLRCYIMKESVDSSNQRAQIFLDRGFDEDFVSEACRTCRACVSNCPTGALSEDRFIVQAGRCITHLNENPGRFPSWFDENELKCLVGCMDCQLPCPMNEGLLESIGLDEGFSEDLLGQIIDADRTGGPVPEEALKLLEVHGIGYLSDVFCRNVSALARNGRLLGG